MLYQSQQGLQEGSREVYDSKGFLQEAGVPRFSMCFNYNEDGVLRLGGPEPKLTLGSVGKSHWGLDFRGFCSEASKKPGQETACGVIPDSGSTLMMGPKA